MSLLPVILLAVAVSLDGLGAGLACGLKRVRVPFFSVALMGFAAGGAVLISMLVGAFLSEFFSAPVAVLAGGVLLIILGLFMSWQAWRQRTPTGFLGLRSDPLRADADSSGTINCAEALVLGIALALDGFAAGFGAALAGFSPWITGLAVAAMNMLFISAGLRLGQAVAARAQKRLLLVPGLLLLVLGIFKIIFP